MREHGGCGSRGRFRPSHAALRVQQIDQVMVMVMMRLHRRPASISHVHLDQKMR